MTVQQLIDRLSELPGDRGRRVVVNLGTNELGNGKEAALVAELFGERSDPSSPWYDHYDYAEVEEDHTYEEIVNISS